MDTLCDDVAQVILELLPIHARAALRRTSKSWQASIDDGPFAIPTTGEINAAWLALVRRTDDDSDKLCSDMLLVQRHVMDECEAGYCDYGGCTWTNRLLPDALDLYLETIHHTKPTAGSTTGDHCPTTRNRSLNFLLNCTADGWRSCDDQDILHPTSDGGGVFCDDEGAVPALPFPSTPSTVALCSMDTFEAAWSDLLNFGFDSDSDDDEYKYMGICCRGRVFIRDFLHASTDMPCGNGDTEKSAPSANQKLNNSVIIGARRRGDEGEFSVAFLWRESLKQDKHGLTIEQPNAAALESPHRWWCLSCNGSYDPQY